MMELELFQIYHLKEMSLSAELFLSCSILQFTFYAISTIYQRKAGFVMLNKQVYYIGILFITLASLLILNEDLLVVNSFTSNNFIINDYFGFASKLVICVISVLFLIIINVSFRDEPIQNNFEYVVLVTISVLGLLLLCSSNDLITAYLAIELHSVAFYIMAAFNRNSSYSIESGLKYFIIGALSSALFLFGSAMVYGSLGSLNLDDLRIFFSILFTTKVEVSSLFFSGLLQNCSEIELFFGNYVISDYNQSFLNLIAVNSIGFDIQFISNIETNVTHNLIDWCIKNSSEDVFAVFPVNFFSTENYSGFIVSELTQNIAYLPWFIVMYSVSSILLKSIFIPYDMFWSDLLTFVPIDLNTNLVLLKHIFITYNDIEINGISQNLSALNTDLISIGFFFICASILIKLSIAPFHFWSLDVYEGSPNVTTVFFAVVPKTALFVLLMRICYVSFYQIFIDNYQIYFFSLAVLSIFVGSFGGIEQRKLKTLLAYSSISHTGYLLLSFTTGNAEGLQMMFYYLVIYMVSSLCFWAVYLFLRQKRSFYFHKSNKELGDLVLLKKSNPMLALILAMTLFSIAGIPPIVGFLAKVGIFLVVVKSSAYLVSILAILFSVVSTFYYIRLIKILYFENTLVGKLYIPITTQKALIISILSLSLIILCIDPKIIYLLFYKATLLLS